jgi:hypothetical protein
MVDVIRALDLKYVAANPGSSFEGLARVAGQLRRKASHLNSSPASSEEIHRSRLAHGYAKASAVQADATRVLATASSASSIAAMSDLQRLLRPARRVFMITGVDNGKAPCRCLTTALTWRRSRRDYVKWDHQPLESQPVHELDVPRLQADDDPPMGAGAHRR